ncbi:hypothetical protein GIB67_023488 [Kingdonia uniflora]|uniref:Stress enhanced protein 1 n=1 Tax=Kingdonia uniflora TaxID=39325 RepID=A0A7J7P9U6_9MAGN|nr:hypothetical protein GIB67_023488 [Kingdonia uniflora]
MAQAQLSTSLYLSLADMSGTKSITISPSHIRIPISNIIATPFTRGSPLLVNRASNQRKSHCKTASLSIRCEQSAKSGNGLDVWLGRIAMLGFASALTVEIVTGKGLLENFGLTSPLPTVALAVTALVGVLTAIFIFQSSSKE